MRYWCEGVNVVKGFIRVTLSLIIMLDKWNETQNSVTASSCHRPFRRSPSVARTFRCLPPCHLHLLPVALISSLSDTHTHTLSLLLAFCHVCVSSPHSTAL